MRIISTIKLDVIVLSRTQTYLAHPFYYNSHAYKHIFKSIPLFIFWTLAWYAKFYIFLLANTYCNIYLSKNVTLQFLLFKRKFSLSTLSVRLQTNKLFQSSAYASQYLVQHVFRRGLRFDNAILFRFEHIHINTSAFI